MARVAAPPAAAARAGRRGLAGPRGRVAARKGPGEAPKGRAAAAKGPGAARKGREARREVADQEEGLERRGPVERPDPGSRAVAP